MVTKKKKPANTDKAQSERFKELAKELEAAGELDLTEAERTFERALSDVLKPRRHPTDSDQETE